VTGQQPRGKRTRDSSRSWRARRRGALVVVLIIALLVLLGDILSAWPWAHLVFVSAFHGLGDRNGHRDGNS